MRERPLDAELHRRSADHQEATALLHTAAGKTTLAKRARERAQLAREREQDALARAGQE